MITFDQLRNTALDLPEATESPHFEKISFRVRKKIFVTYDLDQNTATIKCTAEEQEALVCFPGIYPVPNKWGQQGWTILELDLIDSDMLHRCLTTAFNNAAPKSLRL